MRNLLEYPITIEEAEEFLDQVKDTLDPDLIGDPRPAIIQWIKEKLNEKKCMCP